MVLIVRGKSEDETLAQCNPLTGVRAALVTIRPLHGKGALKEYQAGWLYTLAWQFNRRGARILEIGTLRGYSAAALALAAPKASIITLNPTADEAKEAAKRLEIYKNVRVVQAYSWDYLNKDQLLWDMIFVDGDHKQVKQDLPWFNRLVTGGLFMFHDYSPLKAQVPCVPVYECLEGIRTRGRAPDVEVVDSNLVGMAGYYRREDETW